MEEGGETVFPDPSAKWANPRLEALAANHSQVWDLSCLSGWSRHFILTSLAVPPFPSLQCAQRGPSVRPHTGEAILFWSTKVDGKEDHAALHASCPVTRGEKWTATKWMHGTPFKV